eukprot:349682-Chlamydomonas_euryale.AAC.10
MEGKGGRAGRGGTRMCEWAARVCDVCGAEGASFGCVSGGGSSRMLLSCPRRRRSHMKCCSNRNQVPCSSGVCSNRGASMWGEDNWSTWSGYHRAAAFVGVGGEMYVWGREN